MSIATTSKTQTHVIYEHPVNEQTRLYLRLEHLFNTYERYRFESNNSKTALITLLQLVNIIDRPDLKSKLVKALTLINSNLIQLNQLPHVDHTRLQQILKQLNQHIQYLDSHKDKIGYELRKHDFLNQVRLNLTHPAGPSEQALHALNLWLNQPLDTQHTYLDHWFSTLDPLKQAINLLLSLIRQSTASEKQIAKTGSFQQTQDHNLPCELVRVVLPADTLAFPEISANKHRIMVRFLKPDFISGNKPKPVNQDISFRLTCCRL